MSDIHDLVDIDLIADDWRKSGCPECGGLVAVDKRPVLRNAKTGEVDPNDKPCYVVYCIAPVEDCDWLIVLGGE